MKLAPRRIIVDEANKPVAVEIAYEDWLHIEAMIQEHDAPEVATADLNAFAGTLSFPEDGPTYQRRLRDEWK